MDGAIQDGEERQISEIATPEEEGATTSTPSSKEKDQASGLDVLGRAQRASKRPAKYTF